MEKLYTRLLFQPGRSRAAGVPLLGLLLVLAAAQPLMAQGVSEPIGHTSASEVQVAGAVSLQQGQLQLGNGSTITAAAQPVKIALARGGQLLLCSTTQLHLSRDRSVPDPASTALMMALDRGALEAHYTVGRYSDVLLTPDLRILISGPGEADLSIRVNAQGDTCLDNHGAGAPYVTVSNQLEGGLYRVLPNQRVTFEHGSLHEMVDNEPEPCGCPAAPAVETANAPGKSAGHPAAAANPFPLKESEGLASPPPPPATPVVPPGQAHAQVTVPLVFNSTARPVNSTASPASSNAPPATSPTEAVEKPPAATTAAASMPEAASTPAPAQEPIPEKGHPHGFFHRVGHFFRRMFHG